MLSELANVKFQLCANSLLAVYNSFNAGLFADLLDSAYKVASG